MNLSWVSLLGGSAATIATLVAGINVTGLAHAFDPAAPAEPTTVYVEQPLIELPASSSGDGATLPPLVIAVLPAPEGGAHSASTPSSSSGSSGADDAIATPAPIDDDSASGDDGASGGDDEDDGGDDEDDGGEGEESEGGEGIDD